MNETSLSLLNRLRASDEAESWERLALLYTPLLRAWMKKYDIQGADADDLVQDVLIAVSKSVKNFEHSGNPGAFRGWLKAILINRLRNFWRTRARHPQAAGGTDLAEQMSQLEDPSSELSQLWNREHDQFVLRHLLANAETCFTPTTWKAFCRVALEGLDPHLVSEELGISRNAVIVAKCRVLNRLRQESSGLIDTSSFFSAES